MAEYYKGKVYQAESGSEELMWRMQQPKKGNDLKHSSIQEVDATLDTSRFHISMPLKGTEVYQVDGNRYEVRPGEYFILNPYQYARAEGRFQEAVEGLCVFLTTETLDEAARSRGISLQGALEEPFDFRWQQQEFVIKNYHLEENSFGHYLCKLQVQLFHSSHSPVIDWDAFYFGLADAFLDAHQKIGQQLRAIPLARATSKEEAFKRISNAHRYILDNFENPIVLDDLQAAALLSKYHIVRLYRHIYGITPYQHILQLRVERAKKMLSEGHSPTDVAYGLSFSDRRAFSKVFKRFTGMTPSVFQKL